MDCEDFHLGNVLDAAVALDAILKKRVHPKKNLFGEVVLKPSQLGIDLGLPKILKQLSSKAVNQREKGLLSFQELWLTLSLNTQRQVEDAIGWYEPDELDWEDVRSNRRPKI